MKASPAHWLVLLVMMAFFWSGVPTGMVARGLELAPGSDRSLPLAHTVQEIEEKTPANVLIRKWEMSWGPDTSEPGGGSQVPDTSSWFNLGDHEPLPPLPDGVSSAWLRLRLPELTWDNTVLYLERLYGQNVRIFAGDKMLYEMNRDYMYDVHRILLPLQRSHSGEEILIWVDTPKDRLGIEEPALVGDFESLHPTYVRQELLDLILGSAFIFVGFVMLICLVFLQKEQFRRWLSLSLIILSTGLLVITYSPYLYTFYPELGVVAFHLFDLSLLVLLPSLTYFFERMIDDRRMSFISKFRKFQVGFSIFCAVCSVINVATGYAYYTLYYIATVLLLGVIMLIQLCMLFGCSLFLAFRGNKDALIFSTGFMISAMMGIIDLILFYMRAGKYDLTLWKWGIVTVLLSLIIILGRRLASNHKQLIAYSKELEMFNSRLERSEKMEIISGLAASVAHEVRNPLQVTRGFLQLLRESSSAKDKHFMELAIDELDRASHIITDFLTFAKPELEEISVLNIALELKHIEGILLPLANLQGGTIRLDIPAQLYIKGNSSKLKQAFINLIKNSIEALNGQGEIRIWAYKEREEIVIHIKDNGEGMLETELAMGEPYFSNKTKGTGLGLMVTFRIIEVMQGRIEFKSTKGIGTEAVLRFPSVSASA
ncbi:ATP-binding protein [Paenibacillus sp. 1P07SE]|uniref:ATP-binding protein n=1 Tax=Paenibacillus sp. 1P07SE TaxID=3132209 RepID=UPI0039A5D204